MRKSIDGLSLIVAERLEMDPFGEAWFVFFNRVRDKLKILFWDTNGFWLYYRRLEKGRFKWPEPQSNNTIHINKPQLQWLLSGLDLSHPRAHRQLHISEHSDQSFRDYPITFSLTPKSVIGIAKTAIVMTETLPFSLLNQ